MPLSQRLGFLPVAVGFVCLLGSAVSAQPSTAGSDATFSIESGETYSAWLPTEANAHRQDLPLVLFSHGFGGCALQSRTLMAALAAAGYVVLAPNHKDKACERYTSGLLGGLAALIGGKGPDKSFGDDAHWDDQTELSRRADMENLLNYALTHAPYNQIIDPRAIGVLGHSLGGLRPWA